MAGHALTGRLVPVAGALLFLASCGDPCANRVVDRALSPDGQWAAVLYARDCGATTGISTHVALIPADAAIPRGTGNVLVLGATGDTLRAGWGGPFAAIQWARMVPGMDWPDGTADGRALVVIHDTGARIFTYAAMVEGISVSFEPRAFQPEDH